jgi:hypothetical protein
VKLYRIHGHPLPYAHAFSPHPDPLSPSFTPAPLPHALTPFSLYLLSKVNHHHPLPPNGLYSLVFSRDINILLTFSGCGVFCGYFAIFSMFVLTLVDLSTRIRGVRRGVSKGVEDGCRAHALWLPFKGCKGWLLAGRRRVGHGGPGDTLGTPWLPLPRRPCCLVNKNHVCL